MSSKTDLSVTDPLEGGPYFNDRTPPFNFRYDDGLNTEGYKFHVPKRDFVGYGDKPPRDCWPNGAKIAVSFILNYEEGAEHTIWNGDKRSVEFLYEDHFHRNIPLVGKRDLPVESQFEYGIRAGLPRILKLFKKYDYKFTGWFCARALEVHGDYGKLIIACHGNRWRGTMDLAGPDAEAADIRKSFDRLQAATGRGDVPTAYFTGSGSAMHNHVRARVHKERGVPLLYCSDAYADDLPYYVTSPLALDGEKDEGLLMVPYSLTNNDHRFMVAGGNGVACPDDWFELIKNEFDYMYEEGKAGRPAMITVTTHTRIIGKPARLMALKNFMDYIKTKPDVWVCTRAEMAAWWREKYPYDKVGPTSEWTSKNFE